MANSMNIYFIELMNKWSKIIFENNIYEVALDYTKPKFFITAAFMYPNGPIHIGHGRTYLVADVLARFKRIIGFNVLFPMGFHYTGTPIIAMAEAIAKKDKDLIELFTSLYRVPEEELDRMSDPLYMARYFHNISKEVMKLYGLSIDWYREFTTIDPEFKMFIHWQFKKLYKKNYIEKGTHPVGWCPKHGMPVGMHDTKGDIEPEVGEFIAIFFKDDSGIIYPTATLRSETIFGVTNIWINPLTKYVKIRLNNGDIWVVGLRATERLKHQFEFEIIDYIDAKDIIGKSVTNPITGEIIHILPARFVDDSFATGVVMSVPAHAPYDAMALEELRKDSRFINLVHNLAPRTIIEVDKKRVANAYEALSKFNISSQDEKEKLDEATKYVYSLELRSGFMARDLHILVPSINNEVKKFVENNISGKDIEIARESIKNFIVSNGLGVIIYELINKPVYCRCETEIVVKLLRDQWFIDYGNNEWKENARKALSKMVIVPEEARQQFEATINWLKKRACARTRGLGVPLPWDDKWIIESLSDSTIYMAFYTIIQKIRRYGISPEKLATEFWDYVMLGKGSVEELSHKLSISIEALKELYNEFTYWYPLDARISGKDLIPNHLTFFIFNHVAIYPEELWPREIIANGWVLVKQQKMSKSLRNIIPLKNILEEYGTDVVRLLIALGAEVYQDENIDYDALDKLCKYEYPQILMWIHDIVIKLYENKDKFRLETTNTDKLFWNEFINKILKVVRLIDNIKIREAGIILFYDIRNLISRYLELVEIPHKIVIDVLKIWIPMISIYTPFIAEEIWNKTFKEGFVSLYKIQIPDKIDEAAILALRYAELVIEWIDRIAKATKKSILNNITMYIAPYNHQVIMRKVLELYKQKYKLSDIVNILSNELNISKKEVMQLVRPMYDIAVSTPEELINMYIKLKEDEFDILGIALDYLSKLLKADIEIYRADDPSAPDKGGKKKIALPLRPGIYVE